MLNGKPIESITKVSITEEVVSEDAGGWINMLEICEGGCLG
jgi:hypothetical protein